MQSVSEVIMNLNVCLFSFDLAVFVLCCYCFLITSLYMEPDEFHSEGR